MPKYAEFEAFREQNLIPEYDSKMLHREARALAISRLEESARTEEDFKNVIAWWDKLDDNRERRERDHEIGRSEIPLEWGASEIYLPENATYDMVLQKLILAGDFIDYIFDSPETIQELVTDADLFNLLWDSKEHHKKLLYYMTIRGYSAAQYAVIQNRTERNIYGVRETVMKKLRTGYADALRKRAESNLPLTFDEKLFLDDV
jgi:hypothetical protein